jgi:hypothetical protein
MDMDVERKIPWASHWNEGHVIVHTPRWSFKLRGPDDTPTFIENYVPTTKRLNIGRGWRIVIEKRET